MPVGYKIHPDFGLLVTRSTGLVTSPEMIGAYEAIFRDGAWRPGFKELSDLRRVSAFDVDLASFKALAELAAICHGTAEARTAVLIDRPMNEIISRLYQGIAEVGGTETVRQFADGRHALEWLGCPDFPLDALNDRI